MKRFLITHFRVSHRADCAKSFLISAIAHLFIASLSYVRRYESNITFGINPPRWWEYAISSSLMLVVLLMLGGVIELAGIVFLFTLNFIMNLMGLMMEKHN